MIHDQHKTWLEARGLDPKLAAALGLETVNRDGVNWLAVPYVEYDQTINHKYRRTTQKDHRMDTGAPLTLWNHDVLLEAQGKDVAVVITEGEWDAIAAIQAGYEWTVSVPNGASSGESRLEYLDRCQPALKGIKWFVLAVDGDEAGLALREEMARRLGPYRCKFIEYPDGCKDLNEVLVQYGAAELIRVINNCKPYPIQGLYSFDEIPEPPPVDGISIGIPELDKHLFVVPGTLTVITGWAGAGKTSLSISIIANLLRDGVGVALGTFETLPKPILQARLRAALAECGTWEARHNDMSEADRIIARNFSLIYQQTDDDQSWDIEDILNIAATAVLRKGIRLLWLDPWNEIDHKRQQGENETDYTGRALRAVKRFARDYGVAVWITAHPSKPDFNMMKMGPSLYSISGSAHWANKPDYGVIVSRIPKVETGTMVNVSKVRMGLPGKQGKVDLQYDFRTSTYRPFAGVASEKDCASEPMI